MSEFDSLEREWAAVVERRDVEAARELLADDFVLSSVGGVAPDMPRDAWLGMLNQVETRSLECSDVEPRVFGDVAVVRARLRWDASVGGRDLTGDYLVTDVFTRHGASWRASWRVSVRL
jgi:ketosteroid isomerase-like protein